VHEARYSKLHADRAPRDGQQRRDAKVNYKSAHATQYVRRAETQCHPREPRRTFLAIGLRCKRAQPLGMDIVFRFT